MKPIATTLLIGIFFTTHLLAQENYKPGNPIKGAVIKMGRNPGGDIATQSKGIYPKTGHVTLLKKNGDQADVNDRYRPGNNKTARIKPSDIKPVRDRPVGHVTLLRRTMKPPVWIYADGGATLPNSDAKKWLGLKEGYQFTMGAAIPFNQRFGISVQAAYGNNGGGMVQPASSTIKYFGNGAVSTLDNNPIQKATMSSFNMMAGPTLFKNLGSYFYIQPSVILGYNHFNYQGFSSGGVASFNGNTLPITQYQTNNQSVGLFAIRPDLKFGVLLSQNFAIQASVDYTILPKMNLSTTTFQPQGGPNPQGWYEFQQLQKGTYTTQTQSINPSYLHVSLGITIALATKHAIGTKGMGAQTFSDDTKTTEYKEPEDMTTRSKQSEAKSNSITEPNNAETNRGVQPNGNNDSSPRPNKPIKEGLEQSKEVMPTEGYAISTKGTGGQIRLKNQNQNKPDSSQTQTGGTGKVTVQDINFGPLPPPNKKNARMIGGNNGKVDVRDLSIMRRIRASHDSTYVPNPNDFTIGVTFTIGRNKRNCKGFAICTIDEVDVSDLISDAFSQKKAHMIQNPVDSIFIITFPEELIKKNQPNKLSYFEGKSEIYFEEDWQASDEINKALHATSPLEIKKGKYPLVYENGVYYLISTWGSKKGYDYYKAKGD